MSNCHCFTQVFVVTIACVDLVVSLYGILLGGHGILMIV